MGHLLLRLSPLLLLAAACVTTGAVAETESAAATAPEAADGKALYERSCARCHALYMPKSFSASEWRYYVKRYGRRARLRVAQRELVFDYLSKNARS